MTLAILLVLIFGIGLFLILFAGEMSVMQNFIQAEQSKQTKELEDYIRKQTQTIIKQEQLRKQSEHFDNL